MKRGNLLRWIRPRIGTAWFVAGSIMFSAIYANAGITWSIPLTLGSHDVVGAADIAGNNEAQGTLAVEGAVGQELLNLVGNFDGTVNNRHYRTSPIDYQGTLNGGKEIVGGSVNIPAGWEYAIAKYGGPNAGYVLFHLGGQAATLPKTSDDIWANKGGNGYGLSWDPLESTCRHASLSIL